MRQPNPLRLMHEALVRVMAGFGLLNLLLSLLHTDLDANWLWLGWATAKPLGSLLVLIFGVAVFGWPRWRDRTRLAMAARAVVGVVAIGCAVDALGYFGVLSTGVIQSELPVPLSLICAVVLGLWSVRPPPASGGWRPVVALGLALGLWLGGLVGSIAVTDYRRPADAIVVFGAAVWADGRPSDALADRTQTALALWRRGLAPVLVFSGGKAADAPISEPEAMRRMALESGVPDSAIVLDESGMNTAATVAAVAEMARERGWSRVMMVSHDYHCARVKLACVRQGLRAYTVPAVEPLPLARKPYYIMRELVALAWYWVHPLKTLPDEHELR